MRKNTYIGIAFIVLVFGIIFIPKIFRRLVNDDVTRGGRMHINIMIQLLMQHIEAKYTW